MSIFGAMITAVSGLRAQSFAMENISDNIANSQTTGYKRVDSSFEDLVPDYPLRVQQGGSVVAFSRGTNTLAGNITTTGVGTNVALGGEGFFVVRERTSFAGATPTFSAGNLYTRRGDFELDKNGYLVNGAGNYLVGYTVDPVTDAVTGGAPDVMRFTKDLIPANATTSIEYRANIPASPITAATTTTAGSELIGASGGATVSATNEQSFLDHTISGGSVTLYDSLGNPVTAQLRWGKVSNAAAGPPATNDTWNLYYMSNSAATGATTKWTNAGSTFTFDSAGQLTTAIPVSINFTIDGTALGAIGFNPGTGGLTQFADVSGQYNPTSIRQDGYSAGVLQDLKISDSGRIQAVYSNGQTQPVAQIAVAQFNAANMLKRGDGSTFTETLESGSPLISPSGGAFLSASVEGSNTDIAEEFSKMIITQQAYSANTRVVTTAQQMLQDAINIIR
ncbi:flagellar hook protein FlgE [uncultured Alsobacter sp.]|uniref:flagellar hook protein FlgE n=1 Tax=uncultured Alsobacter sp. TaxID=1748258 RepID=UPI0025EE8743|nr:flagellar hook-basal body complex protein [uncultured Alsobacter sp.]